MLQILSINPANLDILECLTRAHIMLGNEDEAEKCLQAVRSENKSTTAVALLSALFMKKRNKLKEAVDHLNAAVLQNPNSAELWLELGKLHWQEERYSLSLEALLKVPGY
jgi:thioredoxin-like negative regulator of GroEL